jgi:hypothetical protein
MRRAVPALLTGSLAFGLIAAAASSATFGLTLQSVVRLGTFDETAELVVISNSCEGEYLIEWDVDGAEIRGFSAQRTVDDPDDSLEFCAGQPFALLVSSFIPEELNDLADEDGWGPIAQVPTNERETDEQGEIVATFVDPFDPGDRDEITLLIGPRAATPIDS